MKNLNEKTTLANNYLEHLQWLTAFSYSKKIIAFLKNIFFLIVTATILFLLSLKVNIPALQESFKQINFELLYIAIFVSIITNMLMATDRIKRILNALNCKISFKEVFLMRIGSTPLKILPLPKIDLFSQAIYLKKYKSFPLLFGINAIVFGLILNILALVMLIFIGLILYFLFNNFGLLQKLNYIFYVPLIISIFILLFFLIIKSIHTQNNILNFLNNTNKRLYNIFLRFISAYNTLGNKKLVFLWLYSIVFQFSEIFICYVLCKSLGLNIHFYRIILFLPIVILISNLPISFSGIGVRESMIFLFFYAYGTREKLLSMGMMLSFTEHIIPVLIGLFLLPLFLKNSRVI